METTPDKEHTYPTPAQSLPPAPCDVTPEARRQGLWCGNPLFWSVRGQLTVILVIYYLFLVYGSLVPFNFRSTGQNWFDSHQFNAYFQGVFYVVSRVDLCVNILLGIPSGFLLMGIFSVNRRFLVRGLYFVPTLFLCTLFAFFVESIQLYLPDRNAAISDVIAQFIGSGVGAVVWLCIGQTLVSVWQYNRDHITPSGVRSLVIWSYLGLMVLGSLFPLNLATSPEELYHKWKDGLFHLTPWSEFSSFGSPGFEFVNLIDILEYGFCFLPLGITGYLQREWKRSSLVNPSSSVRGPSIRGCVDAGLGTKLVSGLVRMLECLGQTISGLTGTIVWAIVLSGTMLVGHSLVLHRHVCSSDIQIAVVFSVFGFCGSWLSKRTGASLWVALLLPIWLMVIGYRYWTPFNFDFVTIDLQPLYSLRNILPLADYQHSHVFNSLDRLMYSCEHGLVLSVLVYTLCSLRGRSNSPSCSSIIPAVIFGFVLSLFFESGQLFLPTRTFTLSDVVVQTVFIVITLKIYQAILSIRSDSHNMTQEGKSF